MMNKAMERKLDAKGAIDVSKCAREGTYTESWIWSIGRRLRDGVILASLSADLYQNEAFECLWLR